MLDFLGYISKNQTQVMTLFVEHIKLTLGAVGVATLIGVPLGILVNRINALGKPILGFANIMQAIPSMALLGFLIPFLGIGVKPAIVAVILYSLLPIIKNTYTGIANINKQTLEAAKGIGLTPWQILYKVELPLALPVIMAGLRISAVTAVGLMTMAAFIGAGGLGFLVFSGIRTMNANQILAGAVPACFLALAVDYAAACIERAAGSRSVKVRSSQKKLVFNMKMSVAALAVVIFAMGFAGMGGAQKSDKVIRVGTKDYTEQLILGHLVADMIEHNTDIKVERKMNLGGTQVCLGAMQSKDIDLYVEYSGTAYSDTLAYKPISDVQQVYNTVRRDFKAKYDIDVLDQMAFNNTYVLAVREDMAKKYDLHKISDLKNLAPTLRTGTTFEFMNRHDGLPGIKKLYGLRFKSSVGLDSSPRYLALMNEEVDIIDAFSTDGLLKKFKLRTLQDDKNFFPPYYAMPIMRSEITQKHPEIVPLLNRLGKELSVQTMIDLNYQVDELQRKPEAVARDFLVKHGLIELDAS